MNTCISLLTLMANMFILSLAVKCYALVETTQGILSSSLKSGTHLNCCISHCHIWLTKRRNQRFSRIRMLSLVMHLTMHSEGSIFWVVLVGGCRGHTLFHSKIPISMNFGFLPAQQFKGSSNTSSSLNTAIKS